LVTLFNNDEIRKIVWKQIEKDVSPGEQVGGSGHLGHVDCKIDSIDTPRKVQSGWEITYRYTVSVTTEFTIYPDNPPRENGYEKTIVINKNGDVINVGKMRIISSNWEPMEALDVNDAGKAPTEINEDLVQREFNALLKRWKQTLRTVEGFTSLPIGRSMRDSVQVRSVQPLPVPLVLWRRKRKNSLMFWELKGKIESIDVMYIFLFARYV